MNRSDNEHQDDDWAWFLFFAGLIVVGLLKCFQPELVRLIPRW